MGSREPASPIADGVGQVRLQLALVCDDARINEEGQLDVHGVFSELYAPGFPARQDHMVFVLVAEWDRSDEGRHKFRVDLKSPEGRVSLTLDGHTDVDRRSPDRPPARTQLIMPLEDIVFPEPGSYTFEVTLKGHRFPGPSLHLVESDTTPLPA